MATVTFKFGRKIKDKIENFVDVVEVIDNISRNQMITDAWEIVNPDKKYGKDYYLNLVSVNGD